MSSTAISNFHSSMRITMRVAFCRSTSMTWRPPGRSPSCCAPAGRPRAARCAAICVASCIASANTGRNPISRIRGDGHYSRPQVVAWCKGKRHRLPLRIASPAAGIRAAISRDISSLCADQPVEHIPRDVLQQPMKNAILMAHGIDPPSPVRIVGETSRTEWNQCHAPVQQNSTGQPWVLAGRARCHRSGEHALVTGKAQNEDENGGG
jgi:hypothetical protein